MPRKIDPKQYFTSDWLTLRDAILKRDDHACRNCGSGQNPQVHHWLPPLEYRGDVDEAGYGVGENPLIVHELGLVTLCRLCHEAMTERRAREAAFKHPAIRALGDPTKKSDNIFELWALNDRQTPFLVRKDTWSTKVSQYYRVEKIEIGKWPYGKAWGCYVRNGVESELQQIANAGTYTWRVVTLDEVNAPESP